MRLCEIVCTITYQAFLDHKMARKSHMTIAPDVKQPTATPASIATGIQSALSTETKKLSVKFLSIGTPNTERKN